MSRDGLVRGLDGSSSDFKASLTAWKLCMRDNLLRKTDKQLRLVTCQRHATGVSSHIYFPFSQAA